MSREVAYLVSYMVLTASKFQTDSCRLMGRQQKYPWAIIEAGLKIYEGDEEPKCTITYIKTILPERIEFRCLFFFTTRCLTIFQ